MAQSIILTWIKHDRCTGKRQPMAVVWCHNATAADFNRAFDHAAKNVMNVRLFDSAEEDMLRKAREMEAQR
jgi:hypothetical protein